MNGDAAGRSPGLRLHGREGKTMTYWNGPDLDRIATAEELDLSSERSSTS
ncbi:hypothetical protein OHS59_40125 [Streptomyces sp. NBC_00414]